VTLDLTNVKVRLALHHFHNRSHRGEIWLWVRHEGREFPVEQSQCPKDAEVLGEIESKIVGDSFMDKIIPVQERSAAEIERRRKQTEDHKAYREECYRQYPFTKRVEDLAGAK
jgi:hypothetical protein